MVKQWNTFSGFHWNEEGYAKVHQDGVNLDSGIPKTPPLCLSLHNQRAVVPVIIAFERQSVAMA